MTGTIVTWLASRRYGFILPDVAGPEVFVHITDLPPEILALSTPKGCHIQYETATFNGRIKAVRITLVLPPVSSLGVRP
ncbi:MAG: cold shock domain-containing protein [Candidatus Acidiferrales bacterium]